MAPTRGPSSNGRSPLVNQQRQITAFFSKSLSASSPSPSPPPVSKRNPKRRKISGHVNPNPDCSSASSPSTTPSAPNPKSRSDVGNPKLISDVEKPVLVIGNRESLETGRVSKGLYGEEVAGRRIRVYRAMDGEWYEGCVRLFDKMSRKHLVEFDDNEDEWLDLSVEKIEWAEEGLVRRLRRSRRRVLVVDDDEEDGEEGNVCNGDSDSGEEDWGKSAEDKVVEDSVEDDDLADKEDEVEVRKRRKREVGSMGGKLKANQVVTAGSSKKKKTSGSGISSGADKLADITIGQGKYEASGAFLKNVVPSNVVDRFGNREVEKFPFLGKNRRDAIKRRPGEENYDPRTLFLPPEFLKHLSSGQRQWWEFKSKHMDKVLFFKMGKFYELFEMDAHVGVKELDLQYMKGEQPHCGFPEKNFSTNLEKLASKGYRVLVVEQTETPEQLEMRRKEEGSKDKVVRREICAVVTKGTLTEGEILSSNPDASYLMAVAESSPLSSDHIMEKTIGVCVVDIATSRVILGQFKDDAECSALRCLLYVLRPVEIIKPAKSLGLETEKVLARCTRNPLVNELIPGLEFWDADKTICEVKTFYNCSSSQTTSSSCGPVQQKNSGCLVKDGLGYLPDVINEHATMLDDERIALSALGGAIFYLRQAFLDETLLRYAKFEKLQCTNFKDVLHKHHLVLNASALENLEIFENSKDGKSAGTLYARLNHCITASGKRLLRTWLARPLYNLEAIMARQDAIAGLRGNNMSLSLNFRKELSKLPDMERLLARLFASSDSNGRNANKIVLYEDAARRQLQEFIATLRGFELMNQACLHLGSITSSVGSELLRHLLIPGKGRLDTSSILEHFRNAFDWEKASNSGRIIPHVGIEMEYDSACEKIKDIESSLREHLQEQKKLLRDTSIAYVTVGKDSYLLEVPEYLQGTVPRDYELRSSKKGFFRYWTSDIKKMLGELSKAESAKESSLRGILQRLIGRFCEHHMEWRKSISNVAELDVLISLAIACKYSEGPSCRPILSRHSSGDGMPYLIAKSLGHPLLQSDSFRMGTFVPNNVTIGGDDHARFILLTGPNMGGKSTLLRQVCLAVILAQVGADVPAVHFELSLVDKIFVRMGAKDQIMTGQSTFLTELSETAAMLTCATQDSLVALDELGRGTSTSDGQSIAGSVLEYFVRKVQCRGMFSTHYHRLAVDYKDIPEVSLCHMACHVGKGVEGMEEVTFLYKLTPGACPKSYGVNVARIAGIPDQVLQAAISKSRDFEATYGKSNKVVKHGSRGTDEEVLVFIRNLIRVVANLGNKTTAIKVLIEYQKQAMDLLKQK
ncbi:DNA mismatch repair protein MSH6-like protein [Drosera capensis]